MQKNEVVKDIRLINRKILSVISSTNLPVHKDKPGEKQESIREQEKGYPIIKGEEAGEFVFRIKEDTIETVYFPKIYGMVVGGQFEYKSPKQDVIKLQNAAVFTNSDFVLTGGCVVWDKYFEPQFTKMIPADQGLLKVDKMLLYPKNPERTISVENALTLCGVYCNIWSHFLVQHLPKLYIIPQIQKILNKELTVLVPQYTDLQIREIVYSFLNRTPGVKILELGNNEAAVCGSLFHIERTSSLCDHAMYCSPSDILIPEYVARSIKNNLLTDTSLLPKEDIFEKPREDGLKIFIGRNSSARNVSNYKEIADYFRQKGYTFVVPHTLSLTEKIRLFRRASIIAGPCSSGFTNLIFSGPKTKVLGFINYQRCFDAYLGFLSKHFDLDLTFLTGNDASLSDINSSYYIPMDRIEAVCEELGL